MQFRSYLGVVSSMLSLKVLGMLWALERNGCKKERSARVRHARGEGTPAQEAHKHCFYSLSESAENSYWLRVPEGISVRVWRENCQ